MLISSDHWNWADKNTFWNWGYLYSPGSIFAATRRTWQSFRFFCTSAFSFSRSLNCSSNSATLCCNRTRTLAKQHNTWVLVQEPSFDTIPQVLHHNGFLYLCLCEVLLQLLVDSHQMLVLLFELCLLPVPGGDTVEGCNISCEAWSLLHDLDVQYNVWLTLYELWEQHFFCKTKIKKKL